MSKVVAITMVTLDGVMQAPGRPEEDTRGGFSHGGWAAPYAAMASLGGSMDSGGLLFGRRTYEDFYSVWPNQPNNPYTEVLNKTQKYVASRTLKEPLPWVNSTLLAGDVSEAVAKLKKEGTKDLVMLGSGVLTQSLLKDKLVDQLVVLIHPLVLGTGLKLFPDGGAEAKLKMVESRTTDKGVVIATYEPE